MKSSYYTLPLLVLLATCTPTAKKDSQNTPDAEIVQTAENLKRSGNIAGAIAILRQAQNTHPDDPLILSQLGYALIAGSQAQEAVGVFDHLITLHPDNASAYNGKAVALDRSGNHSAAQELYEQALKLSPDSLSIKNNLAMSMILNDQADQAIALLEELNRQGSTNQTVRQNLALAYGIKGDKDKALALNLQDLPEAEAQENLRFYQQYASEHKKSAAQDAKPHDISISKALPAAADPIAPPAPAAAQNSAPSIAVIPQTTTALEQPIAAAVEIHLPDPDPTYPSKSAPSGTLLPTAITVSAVPASHKDITPSVTSEIPATSVTLQDLAPTAAAPGTQDAGAAPAPSQGQQ